MKYEDNSKIKFFKVTKFVLALIFLIVIFIYTVLKISFSNPHSETYRFEPSSTPAYLPEKTTSEIDTNNLNTDIFQQYVKENRARIKKSLAPLFKDGKSPFMGGYTLEEVVDFRSPEEWQPKAGCQDPEKGYQTGFLFLHALTDSTYSEKGLIRELREKFPCAIFRATLMPGHGTVPGDTLTTDYHAWLRMLEFGINSFIGQSRQLFLVGYSTGFTLSLVHLQNEPIPSSLQIAGLIGLAPAIKARDPLATISPLVAPWLEFMEYYDDENPMKYESFSFNLASQFYQLSTLIDFDKEINLPVFFVMSSDDQTADAKVNYDFFCRKVTHPQKKLVWYQGYLNNLPICSGMEKRPSHFPDYNIYNLSHGGILFPPSEPFYGHLKSHHDCTFYYGSDDFKKCQDYQKTIIYGENNLLDREEFKEKLGGEINEKSYYQRVTFNPDYPFLFNRLIEFINNNL